MKVTRKTVRRVKHVPQRTCVGCRDVLPKRQMIRIVRTAEGVCIDPTGKRAGRGAYLHDRRACWKRWLSGGLSQVLKVELTAEDRARLESFIYSLPTEAGADQQTHVNE